MFDKRLILAVLASSFISAAASAEEANSDGRTESDNINSTESSRGSVTQGVIGAEADENKKIIPDSSPGETDQTTDPNIRLEDNITDDLEKPSSETK